MKTSCELAIFPLMLTHRTLPPGMCNLWEWKQSTWYLRFLLPTLAIILIIGTVALSLATNFTRAATATGNVVFPGTISPMLAHSHLAGPADVNQRLSLTIGLRPRNANTLTRYAQDISNPKSVNFHRYLTAAQITDVFGPSASAYNAVRQFLQSSGFTITQTYTHHLLIGFSGTVGQIERVFHVTINNYTGSDGSVYYANTSDPQLPASIASMIQGISGLNNATKG